MSKASSSPITNSSSSRYSWEPARSLLPQSPGVYWFLDASGQVLYVGKAKNLRKRISQYALLQDKRAQVESLVETAKELKFSVQENELQALLVEAELIKKYQPSFNILLKDDKSSLYIAITKEKFPRVLMLRKPQIIRTSEALTVFGPYQSGLKVREVLSIARHIFQWCGNPPNPTKKGKAPVLKRPCFYSHIGLCSGVCSGKVTEREYGENIKHLKEFLQGNSHGLLQELKDELKVRITSQEFEKAARVRDQFTAVQHTISPSYRLSPTLTLPVLTQHASLEALLSLRSLLSQYYSIPKTYELKRIEGYDISNIQGTNPTASMVVALSGVMDHSEYRHFGIQSLHTPNDFAMLRETMVRRQQHPEWGKPDVLLIDGGKGQLHSVLKVWKWEGIVVSIAKEPDRLIIPIQSLKPKQTIKYVQIPLTPDLPATRLLISIRDESHRFAKRLHTIKRTKNVIL